MGDKSAADRVILHVDMDAFFASVEVLDNPELAGRPVVVGGVGARGVVAACTYEARMYGVRSAMPSSVARRLCPTAVFVQGRYHRYVEESGKLHAILDDVTPLVEGISLDEAFLDVTGSAQLPGDGRRMADEIRSRVRSDLQLPCSVGIGRSKLIAKLASKAAKPVADQSGIRPGPGVTVVSRADELTFLHPLPIRALWGIGPVTARRLDGLGVRTVGDLAILPKGILQRTLGKAQGTHLAALSRAIDDRPVVVGHEAKSIGHEETFSSDLWDVEVLKRHLARMVDASTTNLRQVGLRARTVTVKIRFGDFTMVTRSHSMALPVDSSPSVLAIASALFDSAERTQGVRLLGVSLSGFDRPDTGSQLVLDLTEREIDPPDPHRDMPAASVGLGRADAEAQRLQELWGGISNAVDGIRTRFGKHAVGSAALVGADGIRVRDRGDSQWGPDGAGPVPGEVPSADGRGS